jgi:hypothetical protein
MRACIAPLALLASTFCGCALPRGPINVDPYIPRWLSHGDISCECPPPAEIHGEMVGSGDIAPPVSRFHPVPTRPVFAAPLP